MQHGHALDESRQRLRTEVSHQRLKRFCGKRVVLGVAPKQRLDVDLVLMLPVKLPDLLQHGLVAQVVVDQLIAVARIPM